MEPANKEFLAKVSEALAGGEADIILVVRGPTGVCKTEMHLPTQGTTTARKTMEMIDSAISKFSVNPTGSFEDIKLLRVLQVLVRIEMNR